MERKSAPLRRLRVAANRLYAPDACAPAEATADGGEEDVAAGADAAGFHLCIQQQTHAAAGGVARRFDHCRAFLFGEVKL